MRISKERLKQIIKEETQKIISEAPTARTRASLAPRNWWDEGGIFDDIGDQAEEGAEAVMGALGDPFGIADEDPAADAAAAARAAQDSQLGRGRAAPALGTGGTAGGALPPGTRPFRVPRRILTLGNTAFNKILNRLDDQGSIDKETWRLARRASYIMASAPEKAKADARTKAMMILADRANIYHDSPSWETAEARATGSQPRALTAPAVSQGGLSVEDFQQAIRVLRTSAPGADVIGMLPDGPIRDGYTAKFKENVRSILADYPDLEMNIVRREAQNLTNDELVPRLRQMAEKGRGLAPPPESMMAGDDAEDPIRESRRGKITKRQLQQIVKEELSAALTQKKRLNKERMLRMLAEDKHAPEQVGVGANVGYKKGWSGDPEAIKRAKERKARLAAQEQGQVSLPPGEQSEEFETVAPEEERNPFDDISKKFDPEVTQAASEEGEKKISSQKMIRKVNALWKSGKIDKPTWRKARRALYKKGGSEIAQKIVAAAVDKGVGKATVAKSAVKQGITDQDMDRLRKGYMPASDSGKAEFSKLYQRARKKYPKQSKDAIFDIVADSLSKKFSLAANTAQQQKQQMVAKTDAGDSKR